MPLPPDRKRLCADDLTGLDQLPEQHPAPAPRDPGLAVSGSRRLVRASVAVAGRRAGADYLGVGRPGRV